MTKIVPQRLAPNRATMTSARKKRSMHPEDFGKAHQEIINAAAIEARDGADQSIPITERQAS